MNDYPDIIAAMDRFLARKGLTDETRQVTAFLVALAHRVQKDIRNEAALPAGAGRAGNGRPPGGAGTERGGRKATSLRKAR